MTSRLKLNLELYKKIYLIRRSEELIIENYASDEMKTPMHMSMGEEAIVAGVCQALAKDDQVFGTYRSHGLYLAKTGETDKFFAEMYGKATGVIKGKGGSMHLSDPLKGLIATSAVVASTIPLAVGAAYAKNYRSERGVVVAFFGDGAIDEGVFWESLNLACVMKLKVLFVCEDNDLAVHTASRFRHGYKSIVDIVSKFDCQVFEINTTDVEVFFQKTQKIIRQVKRLKKPAFLYTKYYRYLEHVGVYEDFDKGYRDRNEFLKWKKIDACSLQREKLLNLGISERSILKVEQGIERKIFKSLRLAQKAQFPQKDELLKDVLYAQD